MNRSSFGLQMRLVKNSLAFDLAQEHLRRWRNSRFEWGQADCTIVIADYLRDLTGKDYAARFRNQYGENWPQDTGFESLTDLYAHCLGNDFTALEDPQRGDIGVVRLGPYQIGALCLGASWAIKSKSGVLITKHATIEKAWTYAADLQH